MSPSRSTAERRPEATSDFQHQRGLLRKGQGREGRQEGWTGNSRRGCWEQQLFSPQLSPRGLPQPTACQPWLSVFMSPQGPAEASPIAPLMSISFSSAPSGLLLFQALDKGAETGGDRGVCPPLDRWPRRHPCLLQPHPHPAAPSSDSAHKLPGDGR